MRRAVRGVRRLLRSVRLLARDGRIPRPVRLLMLAGLLPVPGPFDALVLLVAGVVLAVFYRGPLRDAWADSTKRVDKFVSAGIGSGPVESPSTEGGTQI